MRKTTLVMLAGSIVAAASALFELAGGTVLKAWAGAGVEQDQVLAGLDQVSGLTAGVIFSPVMPIAVRIAFNSSGDAFGARMLVGSVRKPSLSTVTVTSPCLKRVRAGQCERHLAEGGRRR